MQKVRKTPLRMCVGCREMKPKKELLRVVRVSDGVAAFDPVGKAPGRGAYICPDPMCLKKAVKQRALERALDTPISEALHAELTSRLEDLCKAR